MRGPLSVSAALIFAGSRLARPITELINLHPKLALEFERATCRLSAGRRVPRPV